MTSQHDAWHHIDVRDAERRWRGAVTTTAVTVTVIASAVGRNRNDGFRFR